MTFLIAQRKGSKPVYYSVRLYFMVDILVMAFGYLLLLHFKVTESYNDIKLKNHKHTRL